MFESLTRCGSYGDAGFHTTMLPRVSTINTPLAVTCWKLRFVAVPSWPRSVDPSHPAQESPMLDDTVENNIALGLGAANGVPEDEKSRRVRAAAVAAQVMPLRLRVLTDTLV